MNSQCVFASMVLLSKIQIFAVVIMAAMCLAGCAKQSFDPDKAPEFLVQSDYAPFYSLGPGQDRGPDASLKRGERVKMLRREFGFSYVEIMGGRKGYIANEEIAPAPPREAKPLPRPVRKAAQSGPARISDAFESHLPMPEIETLPEPVDILHPISEIETPADSKPEFRY